MIEIWPDPKTDADPTLLYEIQRYESIQKMLINRRQPWVTLNMISSIDGSATSSGLSGELGSKGDKLIFESLRAAADFILVAANTAKLEKYGIPEVSKEVSERRLARGQTKTPRLVLISKSLNFENDCKFLNADDLDANEMPIIYTTENSPAEKKSELEKNTELRVAGKNSVELTQVLTELGRQGNIILTEGGPSLNGQLLKADLLDELCLTLSPMIVGGDGPRIFSGDNSGTTKNLQLQRILQDEDSMLYLSLLKK